MLYQDAMLQRLEAGLRTILPRWGLPETAAVSLLTISENATYLADDGARGRRIVFRVHRPGYHNEAEILSELAWINALLAAEVVETPQPLQTTDGALLAAFDDGGERRRVAAFDYMAGQEPEAGDDLVKWYRELGGINARLHRHSLSWQRPQGFVRKIWDFDSIIGAAPRWGDWRNALGLTPQGGAVLERVAALLQRQTTAYGAEAGRFGLVHCDLRPANLLVDGERLGVIDFDDSGISWLAYDFAAAVSFLEAEPYLPDLMAAWAEGYREERPLPAEEEAALPMFVMLRRMQLTAWIASHAETPTAQAMGSAYTEGTVALADAYLSRHA